MKSVKRTKGGPLFTAARRRVKEQTMTFTISS
uniref:Uncharacterized protein n=1 Tax=Lepeophtheirus salmonis TaxID=72036 RepID=A0A0K2U411_LEPSM